MVRACFFSVGKKHVPPHHKIRIPQHVVVLSSKTRPFDLCVKIKGTWFYIVFGNFQLEKTTWKVNMEPQNGGGLEDDFPFQLGEF